MYKTGLALLVASLIGGASLTIAAQATPQRNEPTRVQADAGEITFSGKLLFRIRTSAGGYTPQQRAEEVKERLIPILSMQELHPDEIRVVQEKPKQEAALYVRDRLLITVDKEMARANGNGDPLDLAQAWAERLRRILPQVVNSENPNGL